jgi:hypothetical protein
MQDSHSQNKSDSFRVSWVRRGSEVYSGGFSFEFWSETDSPKLYASWFLSGPTNAPAPEDAMASFHIFFPNALFTVAHLVSGNYS